MASNIKKRENLSKSQKDFFYRKALLKKTFSDITLASLSEKENKKLCSGTDCLSLARILRNAYPHIGKSFYKFSLEQKIEEAPEGT